jgi:hypothetical protein
MRCSEIRQWILRSLDGELSPGEEERLTAHLRECPVCDWEMKLLSLPRRVARVVPAYEPSAYFYQRLRARLRKAEESITIWQILIGLSRQLVPALAVITLALLSIFSYQQLRSSTADVYQAYDRILIPGDQPRLTVIADQGEITDESVLSAVAEEEAAGEQSKETGSSPR